MSTEQMMRDCKLDPIVRNYAVVTGGLGYIGLRVVSLFLDMGWEVICLVRSTTDPSVLPSKSGLRFIDYDGTFESLSALKELPPERTVFLHLAAMSSKTEEVDVAITLLKSNVEYGLNLTKFMFENGFRKFILAESYWQFDNSGSLRGNCLYAVTKSAFSLILEYMSSRYLNAISLVLYDVYGSNDPRGKLINTVINAESQNQPILVTEGNQIIDYIHVDDVARAFLVASDLIVNDVSLTKFRRYTVRSMRPLSLRDYIELAANATKKFLNINWGAIPYPPYQIFTPWLPTADMQLPGWEPIVKFEDGIRGLVENR
jgi:nucleoside-diphosphate-sugar epimerase